MTASKADLAKQITDLAKEHWKDKPEALLLSVLGPKLKDWNEGYKSILNGQSLRNFIKNEASDLTIAQHSSAYARVGVFPANETFSYDTETVEAKAEPTKADKLKKSRRAFYTFIEAISDFPSDDIKGVHIPTSVIVRLLEGK
jgi:phenylpyruvate tautomerase PptA (4-oxalocrotonate tautomerase family)